MRGLRALRARILLGAVLWTAGLFSLAGLILTHVMLLHPQAPGVFHRIFSALIPVTLFTVVSLIAGFVQVRRGLSEFETLRARLQGVREGRDSRLGGEYPAEIQPLVNDLNSLLSDREARLKRALRKAGDLAHGLKTPLAVLNQEGERACNCRPRRGGSLGSSLLAGVDRGHVVGENLRVSRHQGVTFGEGLRDQQAVERIAMAYR